MTEYLKHDKTGVVFIRTDLLAKHPDMRPFVPVKETAAEPLDRLAQIKTAIEAVPKEKWPTMFGGKYSAPKVADVSEAAGFTVTAQEIRAALGEKNDGKGTAGEGSAEA